MKFQKIKICLTLAIIISIISTSNSQSNYRYEVEKVSDNVYALKPRINDYRWVTSNISFVIGPKGVLVVDSGLLPAAAEEAIKEIRKITSKPVRYLVNTHWHGDHWQGNETFVKEFPSIEIISSDQGYKGITRNGVTWVNIYYPKYFQNYVNQYEKGVKEKKFNDKPLDAEALKLLQAGLTEMKNDLESVKALKPTFPTLTFSDKLVMDNGDQEIQILYLGIGNTSGDAVVLLPKEKIVISGDLVVFPSPYESGMFSPEWLETSLKLEALNFDHLIPGHGDVQHNHTYLQLLNAFYTEIIKQVDQAYRSGITGAEALKEKVTHQSIISELNKNSDFQPYTKNLERDFVPSAIQTAFRRIIQGKQ